MGVDLLIYQLFQVQHLVEKNINKLDQNPTKNMISSTCNIDILKTSQEI